MMNKEFKNAIPLGSEIQNYTIESVLGHGGFGIVYKARHKFLVDQVFAIKEFFPCNLVVREKNAVQTINEDAKRWFDDEIRRFLEEAKQLVRFGHHSNIVHCKDYFEANGTAYLVMEYLDGLPLSEIIKQHSQNDRRISETQILDIILPLLKGLADVHAMNVLHRDIKPGNIFIRREDEQPVLLDFGAAKQNFSEHTKSMAAYTEGYAAMEQVESDGILGPWTDIYAIGAVMWCMISGKSPPKVESRTFALYKQQEDPLTPAASLGQPDYSTGFLSVIDKCLQLDATERFQSAPDLIDAISNLSQHFDSPINISLESFNGTGSEAPKKISKEYSGNRSKEISNRTEMGGRRIKSRRGTIWNVFIVVILLAVLGVWLYWSTQVHPESFPDNLGETNSPLPQVPDPADDDDIADTKSTEDGYSESTEEDNSESDEDGSIDPLAGMTLSELTNGDAIIQVTTNEPDVAVLLNEVEIGQTNLERNDILSGSYVLGLRSPYFEDEDHQITLSSNEVFSESYELTRATGNLTLLSEPSGASITLDGELIEETTPITLRDIPAGIHDITLSLEGYQPVQKTDLTIEKNTTTRHNETLLKTWHLTVNASPADASIRLPDIRSAYHPGMELLEGDYRVEVSAEGYQPQILTVALNSSDQNIDITLDVEFPNVDLSELDSTPYLLNSPTFNDPRPDQEKQDLPLIMDLHLLIDENGHADLIQILMWTYTVPMSDVVKFISELRYTPPTLQGQPVRTEYKQRFSFVIEDI